MRHIFLTGHKDGKILVWRSDHFIDELKNYQDEISAMSKCMEGIAFCTINGRIYIWDSELKQQRRALDLQ
jgi:hypothetical protein